MAVKTYYQDDGFTGTNYNRTDFQRMIADIEAREIDCVTNQRKKGIVRTYSLYCDTYKKYSKLECSCHYTNYKNLCKIVLESINSLIAKVELDEEKIMKRLRQALIERIETGESHTAADGVRNRQIDIFYKFIGKVDFLSMKKYASRKCQQH